MLQKFALAFKTKTIEFFAEEEEDEDAEGTFGSTAAQEGGILAGQRVVVLKPDQQNPSRSFEEGSASGLATASSFQAAYLHLQAAHSPFLPEAAAAADALAMSHLRRLSELKLLAAGLPGDGSLTPYLEAQVRENQAPLCSFDAVVNRLQAALDAKDAAAASLRWEHAALADGNARLAGRLDRTLAPYCEVSDSLSQKCTPASALDRDGLHLTPRGNMLLFKEVVVVLKDTNISLKALPADLPLCSDIDRNNAGKNFKE